MPPQANAVLRAVATSGSTDEWNAPSDPDSPVFTGAVPAWYEERRQRTVGVDGSNVVVWRTLIVDSLPFPLTVDQEIAFDFAGERMTGVVSQVERSDHPSAPAWLRTTRITLRPT